MSKIDAERATNQNEEEYFEKKDVTDNSSKQTISFGKYSTPYAPLSAKNKRDLKKKYNNGTITKSEYKHLEWDKRFSNRRKRGVKRFWSEERRKLLKGENSTRNWTEEQKADILNKKIPKYNGEPLEGHHKYNAMNYPQLADNPNYIYPATRKEHFERWHGGNYKNGTNGVPNNLDFTEEF